MIQQLQHFVNIFPKSVQCTNELGVTLYRTRTLAQAMRYLNPNHPNSTNHIILDLDYKDAVLGWMDYDCPAPNIVATNPENGHAHYFYSLKDPVHFNANSSRKAQRYAYATERALCDKLKADQSYNGPLAKNPLHKHWTVAFFHPEPYTLSDLSSHLDLEGSRRHDLDVRRSTEAVGLGRNCTLFDQVRFWAYRERRKPQGWFGFEFFFDLVYAKGLSLNRDFSVPLGEREVLHICKSIAKWTWENMSPEGFRLWGDNRRAKSLTVRQEKAEQTKAEVLAAKAAHPDASQRELANIVGTSVWTVNRILLGL